MSNSQSSSKDAVKGLCALLFGLTVWQIPHIAFSSGKFTIQRFQIPQHCMGLYINRMIITFKLWTFIGVVAMTAYDLKCGKAMGKITIGLFTTMLLTYFGLLLTYCKGGVQGHLTLYYWIMTVISLILGSIYISAVKVISSNLPYLVASQPLSGVLVSFYHLSFLAIWKYFGFKNTYYWLVAVQIIIALLSAIITFGLWLYGYETGDPESTNEGTGSLTGFKNAWHPILMVGIGYGLQNVVYPSIAPYKLAGTRGGHGIYLTTLFTGAIPPLFVLYLTTIQSGPDAKWSEKLWWHGAWLFVITEIICINLFLCGLHYPQWPISRVLKENMYVLGFLTILYDFCVQSANTIGTNGAATQEGRDKRNSTMSTINSFSYSFMQIVFSSIGDGYIRIYQKYEQDKDNWPTKHFGTLRAFWFWTWNATKVSLSEFKTVLTTDLRADILKKREYLFIVYTDG